MMAKSKLSKPLSRLLNSDKIDQVYDHLLITNLIMRTKSSTSYALGACLLINQMSTMTSPEEHSGLGSREPNIL